MKREIIFVMSPMHMYQCLSSFNNSLGRTDKFESWGITVAQKYKALSI